MQLFFLIIYSIPFDELVTRSGALNEIEGNSPTVTDFDALGSGMR